MFTVFTSNTTTWESPEWEETDETFETHSEAQDWGEAWVENQEPVESFDGFHNVGTFKVSRVENS